MESLILCKGIYSFVCNLDEWEQRIFEQLDKADIAVLLITQDFLISPFIKNKELPWIRERYERNELFVLPVLVQPTREKDLEKHGLSKWQLIPNATTSLSDILYDRSPNKFEGAKNKVLDSLERLVEKVRQKRIEERTATEKRKAEKER